MKSEAEIKIEVSNQSDGASSGEPDAVVVSSVISNHQRLADRPAAKTPRDSGFLRRIRSKVSRVSNVDEVVEPDILPGNGSITIVVPTFHEVENIPSLVERIGRMRESTGLAIDVLLMDDDSRDGSEELVKGLGLDWLKIVVRKEQRGLSQSVLDGLRRSTSEFLVVMDADLSHPPEKIPELVESLKNGADFALGSRFVEGGSTDDDWGLFRWLNSRVATLLARPLTELKDPMSGFFALRRDVYERGEGAFSPVGYKIGLELLVKCNCRRPYEVPIHFSDRKLGKSKLSLREQLRYVRHIRRLYNHRFGTWSHFAQFAFVGLSGVVVNILLLTMFLKMHIAQKSAVALAISLSMVWNFVLNRRFSFSFARRESVVRQFVGFIGGCSIGAVVNYVVTNVVWHWVAYAQVAAAVGVVAGMGFNFIVSRFLVFRTKHVRSEQATNIIPSTASGRSE
jgi:dolichol-phosphate mannosyltransferase